jgi:F-type H+-transporting ATPase subunit a
VIAALQLLRSVLGEGAEEAHESVADVVFEHVTDGREIEIQLPWGPRLEWHTPDWHIPLWSGHVLDISITKHVLWMWVASALLLVVFWAADRSRGKALVPKGGANFIEMLVVFIRDEIAVKNLGAHAAEIYTPYLCTVFFFILCSAMVGLLPFTSTAVGNISVTATLASLTFLVTQYAGVREQGFFGYFGHLVPAGVPLWLYPVMIPVELLGLFTKPFALCVRLFANMIAGHIVIYFLIGLIFILGSVLVAPVSVAFAVGIYLLEIFVALVQAYIFTMLSALFIGMAAHPH